MDDAPQSMGGKARAKALPAAKRKEIARKAAAKRWSKHHRKKSLKAIANGEREVSGLVFPVYNLDDERRVLSERGFLAIIGAKGRGSTGGHRLRRILSDSVLKHMFTKNVLVAIEEPIEFLDTLGHPTRGYDAEILKDFCIGFVKARDANVLKTEVQQRYASYCQNLLIAFADLGVKAWIDEATGHQSDRPRDALHRILEKYIAQHWATWSKAFPDEFYEQIYRLRGLPFDPENVARPGFIGRLTTDVVYQRLAPGVLGELEKKNPVIEETKRRKRKHHQWLTGDYGHPKLREHISNLIFMMRGSNRWDGFYRNLQRAAPKLHETKPFDFGDE